MPPSINHTGKITRAGQQQESHLMPGLTKALDTITLITLVTFLATGWSGAHAADAGLGTV